MSNESSEKFQLSISMSRSVYHATNYNNFFSTGFMIFSMYQTILYFMIFEHLLYKSFDRLSVCPSMIFLLIDEWYHNNNATKVQQGNFCDFFVIIFNRCLTYLITWKPFHIDVWWLNLHPPETGSPYPLPIS